MTRRFCQRCRLKKCLTVGMKKESILSPQEKMQKKQKIEENRQRKQMMLASVSVNPGSVNPGEDVNAAKRRLETSPPHSPMVLSTDKRLRVGSPKSAAESMTYEPAHERLDYQDDEDDSSSQGASLRLSSHPSLVQATNHFRQLPDPAALYVTNSHADNSESGMMYHPPQHHQPVSQQQFASSDLQHQMASSPVSDVSGNASAASNSNSLYLPSTSGVNGDFLLDTVVSVAIKAEFHSNGLSSLESGDSPTPTTPGAAAINYSQNMAPPSAVVVLNDQEQARIKELYDASRSLDEPMEKEQEASAKEDPNNLMGVINLTDLAIKRIIRMAKQIGPFINMCQEDKIALLKGGCTELMILRSVVSYNPEKQSWSLPSRTKRELKMDVLKEANLYGVQLYEEHKRFVSSFDDRWRSDETVMLLLSAIALFTPERPNVLHKDVVKLEQDTYYFLLRRYLESVCASGCESRSAYLNLIGRLTDLHRLNESHIQLFLEVDPQCIEPLLIEIFDLKPSLHHHTAGQGTANAATGAQ